MLIHECESVCGKQVKSSSSSSVKICPTVIPQQFEEKLINTHADMSSIHLVLIAGLCMWLCLIFCVRLGGLSAEDGLHVGMMAIAFQI